jgi:hypothetical protein
MLKALVILIALCQSFHLFSQSPDYSLAKPVKTIVLHKTASHTSSGWAIYSDIHMKVEVGRVLPGDSVEVLGWAPWLFKIKNQKFKGYLSWKALEINTALEEVAEAIAKQSPLIERDHHIRDSIRLAGKIRYWAPAQSLYKPLSKQALMKQAYADSMEVQNSGKAFLRISASKKKLIQGECAVVDLAVYIHPQNTKSIQFYEVDNQMNKIQIKLEQDHCWNATEHITNVVGESIRVGGTAFTAYSIYRGAYCPRTNAPVLFDTLILKMKERLPGDSAQWKVINFSTKKLNINVTPQLQKTSLTGKFLLMDSLAATHVSTGERVRYSIMVMGVGLTFPLEAPLQSDSMVHVSLEDEQIADTIINDIYYSSKTFVYQLTFKQAGNYSFSNHYNFSVFNPDTKTIVKLNSAKQVTVTGPIVKIIDKPAPPKTSIIAMDVSQSMQIEDYKPTRLKSATNGISKFLETYKKCDVGVVVFGGTAKLIPADTSCYTSEDILAIDGVGMARGTAIGDAIWLAIKTLQDSGKIRKLVIIGDGDNTTGFLTTNMAAAMAKEKRIVIYTIGIGTKELAPYGKDESGEPYLVMNTFNDSELKHISQVTGGKYYWAKDAAHVATILKEIYFP